MKKGLSVKIISGKYKGKSIYLADLSVTRSTKSIVREAVFDTLQSEIKECCFVEVFAGSGTVGIEALSRGAKKVYFLEIDKNSCRCIQKNLDLLGAQNGVVKNVDSFEFFAELLDDISCEEKRIFYFDPPFEFREGMNGIYSRCEALITSILPKSLDIVVIEHMSGYKPKERLGNFTLQKTRKYGKSSLAYYTL